MGMQNVAQIQYKGGLLVILLLNKLDKFIDSSHTFQLLEIVHNLLCNLRGNPSHPRPSRAWVYHFVNRHPEVQLVYRSVQGGVRDNKLIPQFQSDQK